MLKKPLWALVSCAALLIVPVLVVAQTNSGSSGTRKADWNTGKASKAKKAKTPAKAPVTPAVPEELEATTPPSPEAPVAASPVVQDQSQEVLDIDFAMAAAIAASGPKIGYGNSMSEEGVLFDANGASPKGQEAATSRFATFPADVSFVRTPEKAVAAGGSGSSWGSYVIRRGETVLSSGRYISVWRREPGGWKMISELAALHNWDVQALHPWACP
jgi:ketosteroid isomerase-like protein